MSVGHHVHLPHRPEGLVLSTAAGGERPIRSVRTAGVPSETRGISALAPGPRRQIVPRIRPALGVTVCAEARTSLLCLGCTGDARRRKPL